MINRPGRLLNFLTLIVGAYSKWALIRGWALIKFSPFSESEVSLFCNKTINANDKTRRSNKARFLLNTLKKTPSSGKSLIRIYSLKWVGWGWALIWVWLVGGGGGRLFEAGRLLTLSAFRMGAYSRWALIRGWALIRINTVNDLPESLSSIVRLFADDTIAYLTINSARAKPVHPSKQFCEAGCMGANVGHERPPGSMWGLCSKLAGNVSLYSAWSNPTILVDTSDLSWNCHIDHITGEANSPLTFLQVNSSYMTATLLF